MKLTTLLLIFLTQNLFSQSYETTDNGTGNPSFETNYQESKSKHQPRDGEIKIDLSGNLWMYKDPLPEYNSNLFRDDCGNWYRKEEYYTTWKSRKPQQVKSEKQLQIVPMSKDPCFPPNSFEEMEYRLDQESKLEWFRLVKVTFKKIEL